jgi:hypothetical protein
MCGNPFKSHTPDPVVIEKPVEKKVEKVADPAPTVVTPTDTGNAEARTAAENDKQRRKRGYAATRVANDRSVLTDNSTMGGRSTLG